MHDQAGALRQNAVICVQPRLIAGDSIAAPNGTVRAQRSFYGYAASAELQPAWRRAPQPKHRPGLA
jgi:hypothetical protein